MKRSLSAALTAVALLGAASLSHSGGFALEEQSVTGMGTAFAGGAAAAEDATTIYFNPAGLALLKGQSAAAGAHLIMPNARFQKDEAFHVTGAPLSGGDGGDAAKTRVLPNAYYAVTLRNGVALGLGLSVPFGLTSEYPDDWVGRYHAVKSDVAAVTFSPSAAYKFTPAWSAGAGLNFQRLDAELTNRVDFGFILAMAGVPGFGPQSADGSAKLKGDHWGLGFTVGTIYELSPATRVGLAYRSRVKHRVDGRAEFDLPEGLPEPLAQSLAGSGFRDTDAKVSITLPDSASLSAYHRFNARWAAMADLTWTHWSTLDELKVRFESGLPDNVTTHDWEDVWRLAVGVTFTPSPVWTLRAGLAYDQDPIPDAERRTPRVPSNDRRWVALGLGYRPLPWLAVDLAYAHLFIPDADMDKTISGPSDEDASRGVLKGTYELSADILSAQLTANF